MAINWNVLWVGTIVLFSVVALVGAILYSRNRHVTYQADTALTDLERRLDELTLQVVELKLALSHYQIGVATLTAQVMRRGEAPEWKPGDVGREVIEDEPLVRIYQLITEHFRMLEIDELAALAGIPPESYSGDERPSRALSLVQYAARHGKLEELVAACRNKRPRAKWPLMNI